MGVRLVCPPGSLSQSFPQQEIEAILEASGRTSQRRRKLPALESMYYLVARGFHSSEGCRSVLRRIVLRAQRTDGRGVRRPLLGRRISRLGLVLGGSRCVLCTTLRVMRANRFLKPEVVCDLTTCRDPAVGSNRRDILPRLLRHLGEKVLRASEELVPAPLGLELSQHECRKSLP